jgi:hypothetical protein
MTRFLSRSMVLYRAWVWHKNERLLLEKIKTSILDIKYSSLIFAKQNVGSGCIFYQIVCVNVYVNRK